MNRRLEFLKNYAIRGALGSLIFAILLYNTQIFVFSIFPILLSVGVGSIIYSSRIKSYEQNLFVFLEDLKDLLRGGMNIVTSMEIVCENDYGALNKQLERIAAQVKIGIPFDKALVDVFRDIDSPMFSKVAEVISESTKYGGNIVKIFSSVATYVKTINEMTDERKSKTFSTIFSSYFMFFVFIAIILIIQVVFIPMLTTTDITGASGGPTMADINFNAYFLYLIIVQGAFAGPIIGKISEGSAISGIKHSVILLAVSIPIYVIVFILFL